VEGSRAEDGGEQPVHSADDSNEEPEAMKDTIVEAVRRKLKTRAKVGFEKYRTTMDRTDLTELDWLCHAQEEAMDLAVYLEKLIKLNMKGKR
jgi:hypothetical protein